jgi:hypothetical protein
MIHIPAAQNESLQEKNQLFNLINFLHVNRGLGKHTFSPDAIHF